MATERSRSWITASGRCHRNRAPGRVIELGRLSQAGEVEGLEGVLLLEKAALDNLLLEFLRARGKTLAQSLASDSLGRHVDEGAHVGSRNPCTGPRRRGRRCALPTSTRSNSSSRATLCRRGAGPPRRRAAMTPRRRCHRFLHRGRRVRGTRFLLRRVPGQSEHRRRPIAGNRRRAVGARRRQGDDDGETGQRSAGIRSDDPKEDGVEAGQVAPFVERAIQKRRGRLRLSEEERAPLETRGRQRHGAGAHHRVDVGGRRRGATRRLNQVQGGGRGHGRGGRAFGSRHTSIRCRQGGPRHHVRLGRRRRRKGTRRRGGDRVHWLRRGHQRLGGRRNW